MPQKFQLTKPFGIQNPQITKKRPVYAMLGSLPTSPFLIEIPIRKVFRYVRGKRDCFQGRMMIDRQQHKPLSSDSMLFKKLFMMGEDGHYESTEESQKKENPSESGQLPIFKLVMGRDQNFHKLSVNVISLFIICVKREIRE